MNELEFSPGLQLFWHLQLSNLQDTYASTLSFDKFLLLFSNTRFFRDPWGCIFLVRFLVFGHIKKCILLFQTSVPNISSLVPIVREVFILRCHSLLILCISQPEILQLECTESIYFIVLKNTNILSSEYTIYYFPLLWVSECRENHARKWFFPTFPTFFN